MTSYSFGRNLHFMGLVLSNPHQLRGKITRESSLWYGVVPFLLFISLSEIGWVGAYLAENCQPINPLPKLLPIADSAYPLYQAYFGPFVKAAGVFIYLGTFACLARGLQLVIPSYRSLALYYLLVGNTWALVALALDQVIQWGRLQGNLRFFLSWIHPLVFTLAVISVYQFVKSQLDCHRWQAVALTFPSMLLSGPIPGLIFR